MPSLRCGRRVTNLVRFLPTWLILAGFFGISYFTFDVRVYYGHDVRKQGRGRKVTVVKVEEEEITRKKNKKGHVCERKNNPDISFLPFRIWHFFYLFCVRTPYRFLRGP